MIQGKAQFYRSETTLIILQKRPPMGVPPRQKGLTKAVNVEEGEIVSNLAQLAEHSLSPVRKFGWCIRCKSSIPIERPHQVDPYGPCEVGSSCRANLNHLAASFVPHRK